MKSGKIYTALSFYDFLSSVGLRLASALALVYAIVHYNENPAVTIIVSIICVCVILFFGHERIEIYKDRVVQENISVFSLVVSSKRVIKVADIKNAYLKTSENIKPFDFIVYSLVALLLPKHNSRSGAQVIYFDLKNSETIEWSSYLDYAARKKLVATVNGLIS